MPTGYYPSEIIEKLSQFTPQESERVAEALAKMEQEVIPGSAEHRPGKPSR